MALATPFSLLDSLAEDGGDTRERLYDLAARICNLETIRRTDSIEFTDLTTISHRVRTEFSGDDWPQRVTGEGGESPGTGFVFLGFLRRGIPLQHSEVTMFRGAGEYDLPRFRSADTEELAVLLLDAVWLSCATNELGGIPRPLESENREPPASSDDLFNVAPFWQEFLGMRGRSVNPDWDLLKSRFELSESGWANEIWRPPSGQEPKWSYERALLAKLCSKLAFSYIAAAWVPENAMSGSEEPFEIEFEFQERVLRPEEQVERVRSLRRRSKKTFERSLLTLKERRSASSSKGPVGTGDLRDLTPDSLDTDLWRLDNVPETYLGVLDPALDDPDANRRWPEFKRAEPIRQVAEAKWPIWLRTWLVPAIVSFLALLALGVVTGFPDDGLLRILSAAGFALAIATISANFGGLLAAGFKVWRQAVVLGGTVAAAAAFWLVPWLPKPELPGTGIPVIPVVLVALWVLIRLGRFLRTERRETVVLPTWSSGSGSVTCEVSCPPEFIVWQGMLARPSNRGRCWKTRPASELGAKAHLWWSEPNDRGWVEDPPEDRPQLLFLELRARLSPTIALIGSLLGVATGLLLLGPALANLLDLPLEKASFKGLGADFVATVLLLVPTIGGAILIQPGEDPIARKLLSWDRALVAGSTIFPSVLAVLSLLLFGWWWAGGNDSFEGLWKAWVALGVISLLGSGLLLQAWLQCKGSAVPAPSVRQGGFPPWANPRRRPLDVPAPLRPIATFKGRLFAERSLLRLAPRRSGRTPRPMYSLVLPIEGSRLYTPPAPTVLCLIEGPDRDGDEAASELENIDRFIEEVLTGLPGGPGLTRGVRNTNVIGWQPDLFLPVPSPRSVSTEPYEAGLGEAGGHLATLRFFLRLQKANTKPSHLKPVGNGGGLVPLLVGSLDHEGRTGRTPRGIEDLVAGAGLDSALFGGCSDSWRRDRLIAAACRRAVLDVDGVLLIPRATVSDSLDRLPEKGREDRSGSSNSCGVLPVALEVKEEARLSSSLERVAGAAALRAGTGSGAHVWPSSFEPPLAGESPAWSGRSSRRAVLSLRYLFFGLKSRPADGPTDSHESWKSRWISRLFQGFFFDNERRRIPVGRLEMASSARSESRSSFSRFLLSAPRAFSSVEPGDPNARVQRNLWFSDNPVCREEDGRALPVALGSGSSVGSEGCSGERVITDVVGDRVWVWSRELGIDHRDFSLRRARPGDWELELPDTGEKARVLTPEWSLGRQRGSRGCICLPLGWADEPDEQSSARSVFGRLAGAGEVEDALRSRAADDTASRIRVVARLTRPHAERLSSQLGVNGTGSGGVELVEDLARWNEGPGASYSGDVVLVDGPPFRAGGTVVRPPQLDDPAIKAILLGGLVASGKSKLARRLRTRMELKDVKDEEYWEVLRNDLRHNLFLQLFDFDQEEAMDEGEGLDFSRDPTGELSRRLVRLAQETYLLESIDLLDRAYERAGRYGGGVIIEYWPGFSVKVMAATLVGGSLSVEAYAELERHLEAWQSASDAWTYLNQEAVSRVVAIHLKEDPTLCRRRAVKRGARRHNENVTEAYLAVLGQRLDEAMPFCPPSEERPAWPLVPAGSRGIVLTDGDSDYLTGELPRIVRIIKEL